jgi:hypothetical protein
VSDQALQGSFSLSSGGVDLVTLDPIALADSTQRIQLASKAHAQLITINLSNKLPEGKWLRYDFQFAQLESEQFYNWRSWAPDLAYPGMDGPGFVYQRQVRSVLHGSCRKPHFDSADGLVEADRHLESTDFQNWPSALILSGDQIYADDVAGPMLKAIHLLCKELDFPSEALPHESVISSKVLHDRQPFYYQREQLLPQMKSSKTAVSSVFSGARKPIFTSVNAQNHLVSLAEFFSMYLLVWSPEAWSNLDEADYNA